MRRFWAVFLKFARESLRDWGILLLALLFAPFFVAVFHFAFGATEVEYRLAIIDGDRRGAGGIAESLGQGRDSAAGAAIAPAAGLGPNAGRGLIAAIQAFGTPGGGSGAKIRIEEPRDREAAIDLVKTGGADLLLVIPPGFSASLASREKPTLEFAGDFASAKYSTLLALVYTAAEAYVSALSGREGVIGLTETSIRPASTLRPFEASIPSLVILSILTVLFTAAALFVREVEKGTIRRLQLSRLSALEYLAAASLCQLLVSLTCVFLTILTALFFGWKPETALLPVLFVSSLASLSVIAFGLVTAVFCSSVKDVMIVGNFPYFFMLLFSGIMPIPSPTFATIQGHAVGISGFFPLSWGVKALEGMMNFGLGLGDLMFELTALVLLTFLWFALGLVLFGRRHLRFR